MGILSKLRGNQQDAALSGESRVKLFAVGGDQPPHAAKADQIAVEPGEISGAELSRKRSEKLLAQVGYVRCSVPQRRLLGRR